MLQVDNLIEVRSLATYQIFVYKVLVLVSLCFKR